MEEGTPPIIFYEVADWERALLPARVNGRPAELVPRILTLADGVVPAAEVISVFIRSRVTRAVLERMPRLRFIATRSTGYDHIDLAACQERDIKVANVPYYGENTVAEHTFALILTLSRNIQKTYTRMLAHEFSLEGLQGFDLKGKTIGVVGAGHIGLHVIRIAKGFGMEVLVHDRDPSRLMSEVLDFRYADLEELLRRADIVTLHVPYTAATHHLVNRERLQQMKPGALLVNAARGALVDTAALIWALNEGILGGAGLDVLEGEELVEDERHLLTDAASEEQLRMLLRHHLLVRRDNVVVTPHIGFYSKEAMQRITQTTLENINAYLQGQPKNLVPH